MIESTVTSKGQTTLPRPVRERLGLQPGDRIRYIFSDGEVRLLKARSVMELEDLLARPGQGVVSLEEMERGIEQVAPHPRRRDCACGWSWRGGTRLDGAGSAIRIDLSLLPGEHSGTGGWRKCSERDHC